MYLKTLSSSLLINPQLHEPYLRLLIIPMLLHTTKIDINFSYYHQQNSQSTMNFEIQSPFSLQSSSTISQSSPCTPPNTNNLLSHPLVHAQFVVSQKRKCGRKKFKETRHPIYRGVRQRKGKWVCELREPKKTTRIWLGTYPTPEMAARAHDVGALAIRGTSAILNFPNTASLLPIVNSSSPKDIRAAAAEAAESFRPITLSSFSTSRHKKPSRKTKCRRVKKVPPMEEKEQETVLDTSLNNLHNLDREKFDVINSGVEKNNFDLSSTVFFDEEALFNMPGLLDRMAESLCLFPLPSVGYWDDHAYFTDFNLWTDWWINLWGIWCNCGLEEDKYVVNVVKTDFDLLIRHLCTYLKFNVIHIQSNCITLCPMVCINVFLSALCINVTMDKEMNRSSVECMLIELIKWMKPTYDNSSPRWIIMAGSRCIE